MKLPVYLYGHPVLREISADIAPGYEGLEQLVADMFETMYASEGVGLAAPQIGRNDRIVVDRRIARSRYFRRVRRMETRADQPAESRFSTARR